MEIPDTIYLQVNPSDNDLDKISTKDVTWCRDQINSTDVEYKRVVKEKDPNLKEYEIWMEGYRTNGDFGTAYRLGYFTGLNFKDACKNAINLLGYDNSYYDPERNTYWGCRLYDNSEDARKTFN